jgi:hypothetical protein
LTVFSGLYFLSIQQPILTIVMVIISGMIRVIQSLRHSIIVISGTIQVNQLHLLWLRTTFENRLRVHFSNDTA